MNLQSGTYYWPTTFPDPPSYPALEEDLSCDVLIIGVEALEHSVPIILPVLN